MGFGEVFGKTWREYKDNFKEILKLLLIFVGIPSLIFMIISLVWMSSNDQLISFMANPPKGIQAQIDFYLSFLPYFVFVIITMMISLILQAIATAGLYSTSIKKNSYKFKEIAKNGRMWFWRYIGFMAVFILFLGLLFFALIIPGIVFLVFWVFGIYAYFDEKKGIIDSLRRSFYIVKGKWWKTFGYIILIFFILGGISLGVSLISFPTGLILLFSQLNGNISLGFIVIHTILSTISSFITSLIITPVMIIFFKNMYFEWKKRK